MDMINSIITIRHFEKDKPLIIYSPDFADMISMQMVNKIASINAFVYDDDSFYNLDQEITYGSNSYVVDQKPSGMRDIYVKGEDIELIQEAKIVLDNH